jgi:hypothetical protein
VRDQSRVRDVSGILLGLVERRMHASKHCGGAHRRRGRRRVVAGTGLQRLHACMCALVVGACMTDQATWQVVALHGLRPYYVAPDLGVRVGTGA